MRYLWQTVERAMGARDDVEVIGRSAAGKNIYAAHCGGYGAPQIIITAGIHARECYTALVALRQIETFRGVGGAWFVPLVDPDGAEFFEGGPDYGFPELVKGKGSRRLWKANAEGVDLNCNFDAKWGTGKSNKRVPGASDYIGAYPLCAPESRALAEFTMRVMPAFTVSYHSMGGELYWEFGQPGARRAHDELLAARIAKHIGVKKVDGDLGSAGGYKDWCILALGIPAITVELVSRGAHPLNKAAYAADIERNADLPAFIIENLTRS